MRSTQRVTRHAGLRALRLLVALLAAAVLASCSSGTSEGDPDSRAGGKSFEQHCADGRPATVDVAAYRRGKTVVVTWGLPRVVLEPRTYRVLRRGAGERWDRVGQLRLPVDAVPLRRRDRAGTRDRLTAAARTSGNAAIRAILAR